MERHRLDLYQFWHHVGCVAWLLRLLAHDQALGCDLLEQGYAD